MRDYRIPIAFGVAIVAAIGLGLLGWKSYAPPTATPQNPTPQNTTPTTLQYVKTPEGDRKYTESSEFYDIEAIYPDTAGLVPTAGGVSDAAAVRTMETFIANQIEEFKTTQDFEHLTAQDKKILGFDDGRKYQLGITFETKVSPKTRSYIFTIHTDTGGAHPNTFYQTFTWALSGKELKLVDLFSMGKPYLTEVASAAKGIVTKELMDRGASEDAIFQDGFAPTEDNFSNFYLDGKNLVIIFPPYQVAAYAIGTQLAPIPPSSLKNLKSEFK